jgi:hypothetical protein
MVQKWSTGRGVRFYLGTHHPWAKWFALGVPLFVSRRQLVTNARLPRPVAPWALDSGGFTELSRPPHRWTLSVEEYVDDCRRFDAEMPGLEWVAPMDHMCEPFIVRKTGLSVAEHQRRTVENFAELRERLGSLVIPVLQGYTLADYFRCWDLYAAAGVELEAEPLVGVGSVCRRHATSEAAEIFGELAGGGLRLHGFGVKGDGLRVYAGALASADSLSWSSRARWANGDGHEPTTPLFDWPRRMPCGRMHPDEHPAKTCTNCPDWALEWRRRILEEVAA